MARDIDSKVLSRLGEWEKGGSLPELIELYARLIRIQIEGKNRIPTPQPHLSSEAVSDRLIGATPLLTFDELVLDWKQADRLFSEAILVIGEYSPFNTKPETLSLPDLARDWYEGRPLVLLDGDGDALTTAVHTALRPFLAAHTEALLPLVNQDLWRRGYCPVCGGRANFAFLEPEQGARWLMCPRCDAEWLFQRLECPFCGSKQQDCLAYYADEQGLYRLYVCEKCKGYIKAVDLREAKTEVLLPLEWITTLDLDRQATELGYGAGELNPMRNSHKGQ